MSVIFHCTDSNISALGGALAALRPQGRYTVEGRSFSYPRHPDYAAALRAAGLLPPGRELTAEPHLLAATQAHWHAEGHGACLFAADLSAERSSSGWHTFVASGGTSQPPTELAAAIASLCAQSVDDPDAELASFILPCLHDPVELARLLRALGSEPGWQLVEVSTEDDAELGELISLGLRLDLPFAHRGEVLGFGDFPGQGNTRLAPFTELAVRTKEPAKPDRERRAVMAQIPLATDQMEAGNRWHETERRRSERLGGAQNRRARARVSFTISTAAYQQALK
jgi:hypothetical protein